MKQRLMEKVNGFCLICGEEREFEMLDNQFHSRFTGRYLLYNCTTCQGTYTLSTLQKNTREYDLEVKDGSE